jgi:hypothetical protein
VQPSFGETRNAVKHILDAQPSRVDSEVDSGIQRQEHCVVLPGSTQTGTEHLGALALGADLRACLQADAQTR